MADTPKESKSQAEMESTGAKLDDSQQGQLDDLLSDFQSPAPKVPEKVKGEKSEVTEEGLEEAEEVLEEEDETSEEEEGEEEEQDDEDDEEESEEEEEESSDELTILRAELAAQQKVLDRLAKEREQEQPKAPKIEIDPDTLVTEEEARELLSDPHGVLKKIAERLYVKAREDTLKDIPQLVESAAGRQTALQQARTKFFSENAELVEAAKKTPAVARLIRMTADELQSQHPEWTVEQIFDETAKEVRGTLKLQKKASTIEKEATEGKKKASQVGKPRNRRRSAPGRKTEKRSGLEKELDDMLESIK